MSFPSSGPVTDTNNAHFLVQHYHFSVLFLLLQQQLLPAEPSPSWSLTDSLDTARMARDDYTGVIIRNIYQSILLFVEIVLLIYCIKIYDIKSHCSALKIRHFLSI